ncbi:fibronectin type III domain-containing protein [Patescibacteria group bacterium]|nr:fibronectin type III domain-containing protein [Patescibacteria group bacterium]
MSAFKNRQKAIISMCILSLCTLSFINITHAQTSDDITITLQPHCVFGELNDDWMLGTIPDIETLIDLDKEECLSFAVENPRTLRTNPLKNGDILDIDIVVENKDEIGIQHVRSWLNYDTTVLKGISIDVNEVFGIISPGEEDFDTEDGFVMVDASAEDGDEPSIKRIAVARIKFRVIDTPSSGIMINFYDVQQGGHTKVMKKSNTESDGISALASDPGSLHVIFIDVNEDGENTNNYDSLLANGEACQIGSQCQSDNCLSGICSSNDPTPLPDGSDCSNDSECESNLCTDDVCTSEEDEDTFFPNGSPCSDNGECESGHCINGLCQERITQPPSSPDTNTPPDNEPQSTAFALLQVQNFRVTTEGNSVFLGWDSLETSRLKAYNVYYGTTTGQYIQRKTIEGAMQSLVLQSLPVGTRYYFAIRAVSISDEESAFSNEISVEVGNAASSTAPLSTSVTFDDQTNTPPANPVHNTKTVPGETGIPSILVILLFVSAVIGTVFASRRQLVVTTLKPKL